MVPDGLAEAEGEGCGARPQAKVRKNLVFRQLTRVLLPLIVWNGPLLSVCSAEIVIEVPAVSTVAWAPIVCTSTPGPALQGNLVPKPEDARNFALKVVCPATCLTWKP